MQPLYTTETPQLSFNLLTFQSMSGLFDPSCGHFFSTTKSFYSADSCLVRSANSEIKFVKLVSTSALNF